MEEGVFQGIHDEMGLLDVRNLISWVYNNKVNGMAQIKRSKDNQTACKERTGQVYSVVTRIFVKFASGSSNLTDAEASYREALSAVI
jgi:hypothetical protein